MSTNIIDVISVEPEDISKIRVVDNEQEIIESFPNYLVDESRISGGKACCIFFPRSEKELIAVVKELSSKKIPLTISGARTGIVGSAVPLGGGAVVSLEHMNKMLGLGFDKAKNKWFVRVQPNITLDEINDIIKFKKFSEDQSIPPEGGWVKKFKESKERYFYPVDPTETSAAIGGTIATNASGARSFKYGATRNWVKRIRVVIDTGEVLDIERGVYHAVDGKFIINTSTGQRKVYLPTYKMPNAKNAAGLYAMEDMDLIDLFIGSEGIFGVITEADVWLEKYGNHISNIAFFDLEEHAIKFVEMLRSDYGLLPEFIEYFDNNALTLLRNKQKEDPKFVDMPTISEDIKAAISFDLHYDEDDLKDMFLKIEKMLGHCSSSLEKTFCAYEERERARIIHFRHAVPEIVNNMIAERKKNYPQLHKLGTDMSVTDEHLKDIMPFYHNTLVEAGLEYVIWGHIGDNHVHVNILPRNMDDLELGKQIYKKFAKKAVEFGGSVSAEHGIGKIKHEYLEIMYGKKGIEEMKKVKLALDPQLIFNLGNIFDIEV